MKLGKWINAIAVLIFVFSVALIASPLSAAADTPKPLPTLVDAIQECAKIKKGGFNFSVKTSVPAPITVRSAVLSLPAGETGTINSIAITGPDGVREFGCVNTKVQNGTDLVKACGGPAALKAGPTTYAAQGSNFSPILKTKFCVNLSTDFL
ncbi:hypothetical protein NIES4074_35100 [Cylindrospermum sp. NIES-4074]|nr:hypothetical protein NIES4074_35100 [Cylindrospermum sp. NIES-4074]